MRRTNFPPSLPGKKVVQECDLCVSYMEMACGAWSKPYFNHYEDLPVLKEYHTSGFSFLLMLNLYTFSRSATACAAIPSFLPVNPNPSVVFPLMLTDVMSISRISANRAFIFSR